MRSKIIAACGLAFALVLLPLSGCRQAVETKPLPTTMFSNDPDNQMDFWHTLPDHPVVSNDEAFHALLLFFDGTDPNNDYAHRVDLLRHQKMIPQDFNRPGNESITKGVLSVALVRELKIKGGITMMLIGPTQRYATRELQYVGIYPTSDPHQTFSGQEFIGIISKAEDYQRQQEGIATNKPHQEKPLK